MFVSLRYCIIYEFISNLYLFLNFNLFVCTDSQSVNSNFQSDTYVWMYKIRI